MIAVLEGTALRTVEDFHKAISQQLKFPVYYGNNLDALWDCMTGWIDPPAKVIWRDFEFSKMYLGEFAVKAKLIFDETVKVLEGFKFECS
ncbi:barstar family protein [Chitinophaga sp. NPDC101104]|uniref:barstar family protein n=1 Tax=Chitinophaga sp. NPDC101104 TaxID=3390561 RepID=UPI003D01F6D5